MEFEPTAGTGLSRVIVCVFIEVSLVVSESVLQC